MVSCRSLKSAIRVRFSVDAPISTIPYYTTKDVDPTVNRTPNSWVGSIPTCGTKFSNAEGSL